VKLQTKLYISVLSIVCGLVWYLALADNGGKLRIIFCDVGQGDAALIVKGSFQMLIDGGPDYTVLNCLGKYLPFWDREVEVVVMTHPQADHMNGLIGVLQRYKVGRFLAGVEKNETAGYRKLLDQIRKNRTEVHNVYAGDKLTIASSGHIMIYFDVFWPDRRWVEDHTDVDSDQIAVNQKDNSGAVLGVSTDGTDLNSYCISLIMHYGNFKALFSGDADRSVEPQMIARGLLAKVDLLKVPHHGSATGMMPEWLQIISPKLAVISVGRNNRYRHPRKEALDMLNDMGTRVFRTDIDHDIEVESDGKSFGVKDKDYQMAVQ